MLSTIRSSNCDVGVLGGDLARDAQEEAVGELHDVRLVHGRDLLAAVLARVVERELDDPPRAGDRDRLDRDPRVVVAELAAVGLDPLDQLLGVGRALLVLDPGVEVLGVLADDRRGRRPRSASARRGSSCTGAPARTGRGPCAAPTLTERKPPPIGVVIGPLSATPVSRIASRTSIGQRVAVVARP